MREAGCPKKTVPGGEGGVIVDMMGLRMRR